MTVQEQKISQYYEGPIAFNTVLPIKEFTFLDNSHVSAKIRNEDYKWEYGSDYTVNGANTLTRTITVLKEVPKGSVLAVYLDVPITQGVNPEEGGNFPAAVNEFTLDKLTYIAQTLSGRLSRAMQVSVDTPFDGTLKSLEPNKAIKINASGTGLALTTSDADSIIDEATDAANRAKKSAEESEASNVAAAGQAQIATDKAKEATDIVTGFDAHAAEKQNDFDINAANLTARYDNNALAKTNEFNNNATVQTQLFNNNAVAETDKFDAHAVAKTEAFDSNASAKTAAFNQNAAQKQALVNAKADEAAASADRAKTSETNAKASADRAEREKNATIAAGKEAVTNIKNQETTSLTDIRNQTNSSINAVRASGQSSIEQAKAWASGEGIIGEGLYSAKHYAEQAQGTSEVQYEMLRASEAYENKGFLLTDPEGYADVEKYYHSTFDKSKFTVVGNPRITDNGIATFNTQGQLLRTRTFLDFKKQNIDIRCSFKITKESLSRENILFHILDTFLISYYTDTGRLVAFSVTKNPTAIFGELKIMDIFCEEGDVFDIHVSVHGSNATLTALKNNSQKFEKTVDNYPTQTVGEVEISINDHRYLRGSIDLKQFSISVDGKEVFSGNKTGLDILKENDYSVVGNPVISDDGVASGLNETNFIKSKSLALGDNFKLIAKVLFNSFNKDGHILRFTNPTGLFSGSFYFYPVDRNFILSLKGKNGDILPNTATSYKLETGVEYILGFIKESNSYSFLIKKATEQNFTILKTVSSTDKLLTYDNFVCGINPSHADTTIDLNAFKIYVDGDLAYQPCLRIPYHESTTGDKIVPVEARDRVLDAYEQGIKGSYYTIDTEVKNFTMPLGSGTMNEADKDLKQLSKFGNDKLTTSKMYETGEISRDEKAVNQLIEMKRSTFDKSKFEVVGSPTITDDGVASGFSKGNYVESPILNYPVKNYLRLMFPFALSKGANPEHIGEASIWNFDLNCDFRCIDNNKFYLRVPIKTGDTTWGGHSIVLHSPSGFTFKEGITYKGTVDYDNISKNVTVHVDGFKDLVVNVPEMDINYMTGYNKRRVKLGQSNAFDLLYAGSIDLKQFSISVDGKEVFSGNKTGIDIIKPDNFTKSGNPTISDDGEMTTLPKQSIIKTIFTNLKYNYLELYFNIKYYGKIGNPNDSLVIAELTDYGNPLNALRIYWNKGDKAELGIFVYVNGQVHYGVFYNAFHQDGESLKIRLLLKENSIKVEKLDDNNNVIATFDSDYAPQFNNKVVTFLVGNPYNLVDINTTKIDLNSIKIKKDGNLFYQPLLRIPYTQSSTGSKIVDSNYRDRVQDVHKQYGNALYYTLDEENRTCTLPKGEIYGFIGAATIVREKQYPGGWLVEYSNGFCMQGGNFSTTASEEYTLNFYSKFRDTKYIILRNTDNGNQENVWFRSVYFYNKTTTGAKTYCVANNQNDWVAYGFIR